MLFGPPLCSVLPEDFPENTGRWSAAVDWNNSYAFHDRSETSMQLLTRGADGIVRDRKDSRGVEVKILDDAQGIVEAVVSVTDVEDDVDDVIQSGAYTDTLQKRLPKGIWSHDWQTPIAKTLNAEELRPGDPRLPAKIQMLGGGGLMITMQFNLRTQRGREAFEDVKFFGDASEWSIGYVVPPDGFTIDPKSGTRYISKIDLFEYSPVLFGAMPHTATMSIKSVYGKLSKQLREAGVEAVPALKEMLDDVEAKKGLYDIRKQGDDWCVFNVNSGDTVGGGCHPSRAAALDHMRALYVNVPDARTGGKSGEVPTIEEKPHAIRRQNDMFCVYDQKTGGTMDGGCHTSEADARQHLDALGADGTSSCTCQHGTKDGEVGDADGDADGGASFDNDADDLMAPHVFFGGYADPTECRICHHSRKNKLHVEAADMKGATADVKGAGEADPAESDVDPGSVVAPHAYSPAGGPSRTAHPNQPCLVCGGAADAPQHVEERAVPVDEAGYVDPDGEPVDRAWAHNERPKSCPRTWTITMGGKRSNPAPCQLAKGHGGVCGPALTDTDEAGEGTKASPPLLPEVHEFQKSDSGPMCAFCGQGTNHMYHQGWSGNAPRNPNAVPNPSGSTWGKTMNSNATTTGGLTSVTWFDANGNTLTTNGNSSGHVQIIGFTGPGAASVAPGDEAKDASADLGTEDKGAVGLHTTTTDTGAWDGAAEVKKLGDDVGIAKGNRMFAWRDPDADAATKDAWKFPHHTVGENDQPGAANLEACSAGIAALNGGRGGSSIPSGDRQGVYGHLAKHLRDGGRDDIPELKELDEDMEIKGTEEDGEKATTKKHPFIPKKGDPAVCNICGQKKDAPIHDTGDDAGDDDGKSTSAERLTEVKARYQGAIGVLNGVKALVAPDVAAAIALIDSLVDELMESLGIPDVDADDQDDDADDAAKAADADVDVKGADDDVETKIDVSLPGSYEQVLGQIMGQLQASPPAAAVDGAQTVTWVEATFADNVLVGCADVMTSEPSDKDDPAAVAGVEVLGQRYLSYPYKLADGGVSLGDPTEVAVSAVLSPKGSAEQLSEKIIPAIEAKIGRTLSAQNADSIRGAVLSLIDVLSKAGIDVHGEDAKALDADEEKAADQGEDAKTALLSAAEVMRFKMLKLGLTTS